MNPPDFQDEGPYNRWWVPLKKWYDPPYGGEGRVDSEDEDEDEETVSEALCETFTPPSHVAHWWL